METQSKVLRWSLIIGIVIVLNLFFNYTLSLIYDSPSYEVFCGDVNKIAIYPDTSKACVDMGGQWINNTFNGGPTNIDGKTLSTGYCNLQFTCQNNYDTARNIYDRNVFITLVLLGAISVAIGSFLTINMLISIALSFAGVLSFIIASMRYWSSAEDLIKVIILAVALAILVWVAIKKFKN